MQKIHVLVVCVHLHLSSLHVKMSVRSFNLPLWYISLTDWYPSLCQQSSLPQLMLAICCFRHSTSPLLTSYVYIFFILSSSSIQFIMLISVPYVIHFQIAKHFSNITLIKYPMVRECVILFGSRSQCMQKKSYLFFAFINTLLYV